MEKFWETVSNVILFLVAVPILIIFVGWAINVVHIFGVIGDKLEAFIGNKIDARIYAKHCQLRREIDGD